MKNRFEEYIKKHFPQLLTSKFVIAVSGGLDSTVLSHLCDEMNLDFALAHCNFNLRGEDSNADEHFVRDLSERLGVLFHVKSFDTQELVSSSNLSTQMAARELRYQWFEALSSEFAYTHVLTAHHLDDTIETYFINLLRGTGIEGLKGIPARNGNILRPLLSFTRLQLQDYAHEKGIQWREDQSNQEVKYIRNKIRHQLIPVLKEINPDFAQQFRETQQHLQGTAAMLANHIAALKKEMFRLDSGVIEVSVGALRALQPLDAYLYELFKEFQVTAWRDLKALLDAQSGKQLATRTHRIVRDRDRILIAPIAKEKGLFTVYQWAEGLSELEIPLFLRANEVSSPGESTLNTIYIDKETLKFPLVVRKWKNGDYFYPDGMQGRKKLSKFFKDEKYTLFEKESQWLLCSEDQIVWIIGKRADRRFLATPSSKEILEIHLKI
ncbi:tRNA lysidine(34) synthetase TilS [Flavobacteriaceae bacterium M23B6Z8]